ncbi:hypothetical protein RHGRI_028346 [Rhododendron griersonianum]|uniref:Thioredoxin domain-containing protein n=1 Tax=Rhododendron griersonianum TaxID=479676 RepID=A0AAV6IJD8_9ERIC|nr:hypothetical protein RHGRI_028346 [Rhododendron griersonianum]
MGACLSSWLGGGADAGSSESSSEPSSVIMVVDFSASWCGPCKLMEPVINAMSSKFADVEFIKIDVDELSIPYLPLA